MTAFIPENAHAWLIDDSIVPIAGDTMPPRNPNDNDDDSDDEEGDSESDDDREPAVIREPDE
jgi:hypothetical protein